jgi:hypothetical protein
MSNNIKDIPEWKVKVEMRGLNGTQRSAFLAALSGEEGALTAMYGGLLVQTLYDPETGARIFSDTDVDAINRKSGKVLDRLAMQAMRLSGLDPAQREEEAARFPDGREPEVSVHAGEGPGDDSGAAQ